MNIISIVNQKGGVAKTTTALNLAYGLYTKGYKVLMIDLDSQGSLSLARGIENLDEKEYALPSLILKEIEDEEYNINDYITVIKNGLDIIPCNIRLTYIESKLINCISREFILSNIIKKIDINQYDYIILDCSPALSLMTINALGASNNVIVPITPSKLSVSATNDLMKTISTVKKKINPKLHILGFVLTMVDKRSNYVKDFTKEFLEMDFFYPFTTQIPYSVKAVECVEDSLSALEIRKNNIVKDAYQKFCDEVIEKIKKR